MAAQNVHSIKEVKLALSNGAKPRLKWTQELHHKFEKAVDRLGGPEKATPKSLVRVMGINGLTLYHLKSHLQKYRTGKSVQMQRHHQTKEKENGEMQSRHLMKKSSEGPKDMNESLQITRALQIQMGVQRKLHEQMEVQRHLQLRIEAQGKYLQSVLLKAQEILRQCSSCNIETEQAKARLSRLVSMVGSKCTSPTFSVLTLSGEGISMSGQERENDSHESCESSFEGKCGNEEAEEEESRNSNNGVRMKTWENLDLNL